MPESTPTPKKQGEKEPFYKWLLQVLGLAIIFLGIYLLIFKFVLSNETVSGPSMQPTFENGDRIIALRHTELKRGDVVILDAPDQEGVLYIKRIIGMPGDTVESKNDVMYINGKVYKQPFLKEYEAKLPKGQLYTDNFSLKTLFGTNKVPKDCYFVMGDHRDVSKDSRVIGFIRRSEIEGKVVFRYFPFNEIKVY